MNYKLKGIRVHVDIFSNWGYIVEDVMLKTYKNLHMHWTGEYSKYYYTRKYYESKMDFSVIRNIHRIIERKLKEKTNG